MQYWVELDNDEQKQQYSDYLRNYIDQQKQLGRFTREHPKFSLRDVNQWMTYNKVVSEDNKILVLLSFMFLAVCLANILGLLLAKFMRRAPEVGVRRALGASKHKYLCSICRGCLAWQLRRCARYFSGTVEPLGRARKLQRLQ